MAHQNTILAQMLKLVPRHEFDRLSEQYDGKRRAEALTKTNLAIRQPSFNNRKTYRGANS